MLAWLQGEPPAGPVIDHLLVLTAERGHLLATSWVAGAEVLYIVERRAGVAAARLAVESLGARGVAFMPAHAGIARDAARIKARHAMSLADAFVCATALSVEGPVLTGDPELLIPGAPWHPIDLRTVELPALGPAAGD